MQNQNGNGILEQYTGSLSQHIQTEYSIPPKYYRGDLKLGLRNSDGTGVPIGVTRVGSVLGYMIEDGKLTQPIKDINIIGNGPKALADITMVATNAKIDNGTWTCGKDGQSCPVTCGMPSALVSKLTVGGEN